MGRVAVVSAYYNRGDCVDETLSSVLSQDEDDLEIVFVDDGSQDDTYDRMMRYTDIRFRAIRQENQGFVAAMNRAIAETTAPYIAVLGSGDLALPERFRKQAAHLDTHPACAMVGCYHEVFHERTGTSVIASDVPSVPYREALLVKSYFSHSEVMFRRSVFEEVGGYRNFFRFAQDFDLWLRMSDRYEIDILPEVLNRVMRRLDSVSGNPVKYGMQQRLTQIAIHCALERRAGRPDPVDKYGHLAALYHPRSARAANNIANQAFKCIKRGQASEARYLRDLLRGDAVTPRTLLLSFLLRLPQEPLVAALVFLSSARRWWTTSEGT